MSRGVLGIELWLDHSCVLVVLVGSVRSAVVAVVVVVAAVVVVVVVIVVVAVAVAGVVVDVAIASAPAVVTHSGVLVIVVCNISRILVGIGRGYVLLHSRHRM